MTQLLVIDRRSLETWRAYNTVQADDLAAEDALGILQIEWALRKHGRCDGTNFTIIDEFVEGEGGA